MDLSRAIVVGCGPLRSRLLSGLFSCCIPQSQRYAWPVHRELFHGSRLASLLPGKITEQTEWARAPAKEGGLLGGRFSDRVCRNRKQDVPASSVFTERPKREAGVR